MRIIDIKNAQAKIIEINGDRFITDYDAANLYQVTLDQLYAAISNYPKRFSKECLLEIDSQLKEDLSINPAYISSAEGSEILRHLFTEKGLYMLATVIDNDTAEETLISIIGTFSDVKKIGRKRTLIKLCAWGE